MPTLNEDFLKSLDDAALGMGQVRPYAPGADKPSALRAGSARVFGGALKVLDIIERPYYGLMNVAKDLVGGEPGVHPIQSAWKGISGQEKTQFGDVTTELGWKPQTKGGKAFKFAVDFGGGLLADPSTYLTAGLGKGATVLGAGSKPFSSAGTKLFEKMLAKELGVKVGTKEFTKAVQAMDLTHPDLFTKVARAAIDIAETNPNKYYAKTFLKFAGKELVNLTDTVGKVKPAFKPLLDIKLPGIVRSGKARVSQSLGDAFIPYYSIMNKSGLTASEKYAVISKLQDSASRVEHGRAKAITETMKQLKGIDKKTEKEITYLIEKALSGPVQTTDDYIRQFGNPFLKSGMTLEESEQAYNMLDEALDSLTVSFSDKSGAFSGIPKHLEPYKEQIKQITDQLYNMGRKEMDLGIRKEEAFIKEGYVARKARGWLGTEARGSSRLGRKEGGQSVEESVMNYQQGKQDWYFEPRVSKWLSERKVEHDAMVLKNEAIGWLEQNNFIKLVKADKDVEAGRKAGMETIEYLGKKYVADPDLAREFNLLNKVNDGNGMTQALKLYDTLLNSWKLSVTSLFPSFHSRNFVSNVYLGWLAGNNSIQNYNVARMVQSYGRAQRVGKEVADQVVTIGKNEWKVSELYDLAVKHGVLGSGFMGGDLVRQAARPATKLADVDLANTFDLVTNGARRVGTMVENNARVSLFVDQLNKGFSAREAAVTTKKFLFDYGELTEFEKSALKRVIPFYTWMRKNIPLQIEQIAKQPGKYTAFVHAQQATEDLSVAKEEQYLPNWLRTQEMMIRVGDKKYYNPDLPFQDLASVFDLRKYVSASSPLIKGWFEILSNKNFYTGRPLADETLPQSEFEKEKYKQWVLDNMRTTSFWNKAKAEDRTRFQFYVDFILGLRSYNYDITKSKKAYYKRQKTEKKSMLRLDKKEEKAKQEAKQAMKTIFFK